MPVIIHEIVIDAPESLCFDLARNVEVHTLTTSKTKEKVIGGVMKGHLEKGDQVIWEATHFGIKQRLTAKVVEMDKPNSFIDVMVQGAFHSFTHTHQFTEDAGRTIMRDTFEYRSPMGLIGVMADKLFLEKYMRAFIVSRAHELKRIAEELASE